MDTQLISLVFFVPVTIVLVVGVVLAIRARREHGKAAMLGLAGCLVLLADNILQALRSVSFSFVIDTWGIAGLGTVSLVTGLLSVTLTTVGTGLLIWGVVARRTRPAQFPHPQRPPYPYHGVQPGYPHPQQPPAPQGQFPQQQPPAGQFPHPGPQPPHQPPAWQPPQQG